MSDFDSSEITQVNLASIERNAGRDYHEHFSPRTIKLVLATWSKAELDAQSLDNSMMFQYRFGFETHEAVRKQVLEIKNRYDFSDREIRWLRYSDQFIITSNEAKLKPSQVIPLLGWAQLCLFSLICLGMMLQITFSSAPLWQQAVGEIAVAGISFGVFGILNALYIAPWRTLKRSGALPSTESPR